jgi:hypothetical protein
MAENLLSDELSIPDPDGINVHLQARMWAWQVLIAKRNASANQRVMQSTSEAASERVREALCVGLMV